MTQATGLRFPAGRWAALALSLALVSPALAQSPGGGVSTASGPQSGSAVPVAEIARQAGEVEAFRRAVEETLVPGTQVELELDGERYYAVTARTFADARPGDVILYEDSYRNMSVAINRGSAAATLHAQPGRKLGITALGATPSLR